MYLLDILSLFLNNAEDDYLHFYSNLGPPVPSFPNMIGDGKKQKSGIFFNRWSTRTRELAGKLSDERPEADKNYACNRHT